MFENLNLSTEILLTIIFLGIFFKLLYHVHENASKMRTNSDKIWEKF